VSADRNVLVIDVIATSHIADRNSFAEAITLAIEDLCVCNDSGDITRHSFDAISTRWETFDENMRACDNCAHWLDPQDSFGERVGLCVGFVAQRTPADFCCNDWTVRS
jgi:hypothetical protein